MQPEMYHSSQK